MRSTSELRRLWAPACSVRERGQGFRDAWRALAQVMAAYHYVPRRGDTYARSCRSITGGSGYSLHAYFAAGTVTFANGLTVDLGLAMDINSRSNPYGSRLVTDMPRAMVDAICAIRTNGGAQVFRWGGYYTGNKDAMHYEIVASPAELAQGINQRTVHAGGVLPSPPPVTPTPSAEEEEEMQPILGVQKSNGAGYVLLLPNVGSHPVVKVPLADWDVKGGAGGVDDALRANLMVYVRADDAMVDRIPDAG